MHYLEKDPDHDMSSRVWSPAADRRFRALMRTFETSTMSRFGAVGHDGNIATAGHHGLAAAWHPGRPALGIPHHSGPTGVRGEAQIVDDDDPVLPNSSMAEVEVRGPWIAGSYYGDVTVQSSIPAGCAPVTSAASTGELHLTDRAKERHQVPAVKMDLLG